MMKSYIRIIIATMLLFGACKTQKPVVKDSISQTPIETVQSKTDTVVYNYPPPRNYNIPKRIFKEIENFETAFDELKAMLEGKIEPNFERAVFISENPFHSNKYQFDEFQKIIDAHIFFINKLVLENDKSDSIDFNVKVNQYGRFNLDDIRHLPDEKKELYKKSVRNWAIFKYLTDTIFIFMPSDSLNIKMLSHNPFTYSSNDPFGKKNWANSQVLNLVTSKEQKGNCFALTGLYKILADRLNADARICTAPQHIYIQHRDKKGDYYNVELATAGHPGDGTIQTLTHTTTEGIKSGIALRSFDTKQSIGLCLVNLAKSYEHKFGSKDDDFMLKCAELVLKHDPLNLNALLLKQQILDTRVTDYAKENNINDINALKSNSAISKTVYELERHLALLYQLGYRQMPFDMQEIIMTGVIPENFEDKNPTPFTTIDPKDEHRKKFTTLYGGLFQEVFVTREFEPYGHFTFQTSSNKITVIDTTAQTGFLIDPVAFAYDFGARMYDARLGRFLSVDPQTSKLPNWSPYAAFANNPIYFIDPDGELPIVPILLAAWAVTELALSAYDAYETGKTLMDPNATTGQKFTQAGLFAVGLLAPGGGYGTMGKAALSKIDNALVLAKSSKSYRGLKPSVSKLTNFFENTTASKIAERGDNFIGFGDDGVRKALGMKSTDKAADFLSVSQSGKFNIAESKAAFGSAGAEIGDAMNQLQSTFNALKKNLPNAELGNVQIFLPKGANLKGGYSVSGNQLVKIVDGKTEVQKVGGQVVTVAFQ
ncbi:MAG: RHS repeat-associated core domain-containing protein [Vicingaceae bacterium]|nr:MAG: RHS repeat-associated core domain-containing protein [Vicingaceae bacterium]